MQHIGCFMIRLISLTLLVMIANVATAADEQAATAAQLEFFETAVRPLLARRCYSCHSVNAKKLQANLRVDSRGALLHGGDSGEAIVPGDVDGSLLIEAVRYDSYEMPPKGKLPPQEIQTLEQWVAMGAPWPTEDTPTANAIQPDFDLRKRVTEHWVWQPVRTPSIPDVINTKWPRNDLDRFVLARLDAADLQPATDTDRSALLRRLCFDLTGLPPTTQQSANFLHDDSPQATARLVDELLGSPHFGEHWGRHWLDLVRYAESRGHEFDNDSPNAFQYRDYVIRAFNVDVPYDQLVREHIAGDLVAEPRLNPERGFNESVLGTGFWFLGEWVHSPVDIRKDEADRFDNMIDVMSKTFLGLTVACARCHDHKFDAISTADYYSLCGFLQSSDFRNVRFESLEHNRNIAIELAALDTDYQQQLNSILARREVLAPTPKPLGTELARCVVVDYETLTREQYFQDGFIFGDRPMHAGDASLAMIDGQQILTFPQSAAAASDSFWDGLESVHGNGVQDRSKLATIPRSGRTLRTPTFTLTSGNVACRVRGTGHVVACVDSHRLIAGPLHGETIKAIKPNDRWVELNLTRYIGHRLHLEFTPAKNAHLRVSLVTQGASQAIRKRLAERENVIAESVRTYAESARRVLTEDAPELVLAWAEQRSKLQSQIMQRSHLAMAMMDGTGEDDHVLIRGNASKPGAVEPRHFLTAVAGARPMSIASGSGRLELARQINDPANPLTSRVIVNRIWHYLMGRGIVPSTDNFGVLGLPPTHPDLLDHLAVQFVADGRSIKHMIRNIVLSRTYQMSSHVDASALAADPKNLLWHYRPPRRLEGEAIRDSLLSLSGRLDLTQYGEPVPIHLTPFMDGRGRPKESGPLDGAGRRSIYTAVRRNFLSPFMLAFDTPVPFSTMGRRNVSNVPAQALILMNDPFVVEQAKLWAERALQQQLPVASRIDGMYRAAFARPPTERELAAAIGFFNAQATARNVQQSDIGVWADFAHALINTKEFIYLQ
jgi:Protein of unknown function (DUF1553)/Protein of unknown function (DUF1549)/Planctomycete cytochrome C